MSVGKDVAWDKAYGEYLQKNNVRSTQERRELSRFMWFAGRAATLKEVGLLIREQDLQPEVCMYCLYPDGEKKHFQYHLSIFKKRLGLEQGSENE